MNTHIIKHTTHKEVYRKRQRNSVGLTIAKSVFGFTVIISPQMLGGVTTWATVTIAFLSIVSVLVILLAAPKSNKKDNVSLFVLFAMLGALGWTALQALPLPCSVVRIVAPKNVHQLGLTMEAIGTTPATWCTLSRDPGSTELEVIKGIAIVAIFCGSWLLVASRSRIFILTCIACSGIGIAVVTLLHRLALADKVFGVYVPKTPVQSAYSPLLNPNHLAGFLTMSFPLLIAFGLQSERTKRVLWLATSVLMGVTIILTLSRSGIAAFICSGVLFWMVNKGKGRNKRGLSKSLVLGGLSVLASLLVGSYIISEKLIAEFSSPSFSKMEFIQKGFGFSLEQWWIGIGRGAFSPSFVNVLGTEIRFAYPENIVVQWVSEWGIGVAGILFTVCGVAIVRRLMSTRSLYNSAALMGVTIVTFQNLVDFGLEMTGVIVVASALFAAGLASGDHRHHSSKYSDWFQRVSLRKVSLGVLITGLLALTGLTPRVFANDGWSLRYELERLSKSGNRPEFKKVLTHALTAHPWEPNYFLLASIEAIDQNDPRAVKLLNRTMVLAPNWTAPHILAAQLLFAKGHTQQALLEVRETFVRRPRDAHHVLCKILNKNPVPSYLLRATPKGKEKIPFLEMAASCIPSNTYHSYEVIDNKLLHLDPTLISPRIRKAQDLFRNGKEEEAIQHLRLLVQQHPRDEESRLALAGILIGSANTKKALDVLRKAETVVKNQWKLVSMRAQAEATLGDAVAMRRSIGQLRGLAQTNRPSLAQALQLQAQLELQMGNTGHALKALEESNRFFPSKNTLKNIARLARKLGDIKRAYSAISSLCDLEPLNKKYCSAKEQLVPSPNR